MKSFFSLSFLTWNAAFKSGEKIHFFKHIIIILFATGSLIMLNTGTLSAKETFQKKTVSTKSGLNVRKTADAAGQKIGLIPFGETVEVTEMNSAEVTVAGKTGHWVKVKWKNLNGWGFDAFLGNTETSPLYEHFKKIALEVRIKCENGCTVRKDAESDTLNGECGNSEITAEPVNKPAWVSGNTVVFEYTETEYSENEQSTTRIYECSIDGKKILATKEGETLTIEVICREK